MARSFQDIDGSRVELIPPRDTARRLHEAFMELQSAQSAYADAFAGTPSYTGGSDAIDYSGRQEQALNRAVDAFEDAVVASVDARCAVVTDPA